MTDGDALQVKRTKHAAYMRQYNTVPANREKNRERGRQYYAKNRARRLARQLEYAEENREKVKAYQKAYAQTPEGKARRMAAEYRRRALRRGCDAQASALEIAALFAAATDCVYCRGPFSNTRPPTLEHMVPLSRGGPHSIDNLAVACLPCNSRKRAMLASEFIEREGFAPIVG